MKIGIFNPYLDGLTGGERYILTLASCLSKSNTVAVLWDDKTILRKAEKKFGLDLSRVVLATNIFSSKTSTLKRLIESTKYDAIVYLSDGSIPLVLSKLFIHFQFPVEWVNGRTIKNRIKMLRASRVFCNSKFTKNYIDKTFGIKTEVLYPPIEYKVKKVQKENVILTVGRFGRTEEGANYKKHDVLIKAFEKMVEEDIKDWKFVLVVSLREEDKDRFKSLQDLAKGFPVEFVVNPSNEILWDWYSKAKIYWHASGFGEDLEKHPEYAEHFGMSTVEAMSAGAVPVVINAGGQKEIVGQGVEGYLWDTIQELIAYTKKLMEFPEEIKKFSQASTKKAGDFSTDNFREKLSSIIHL